MLHARIQSRFGDPAHQQLGEEAVRTTIGWTHPRIHLRHSSLA
jgi:hypothetical protein